MCSTCLHDQTLDLHRVRSALFARTLLVGSVETARAVGAETTLTSGPSKRGQSAGRRKQPHSHEWRFLYYRASWTRSADHEEEHEVEHEVVNVARLAHLGPVSSSFPIEEVQVQCQLRNSEELHLLYSRSFLSICRIRSMRFWT